MRNERIPSIGNKLVKIQEFGDGVSYVRNGMEASVTVSFLQTYQIFQYK